MQTKSSRRAVIDLGTNTFHLLIAEIETDSITEIYRERRFVKLAADGIETIGPEPFARGIQALTHFAEMLREHDCHQLTAFGTAALRTASNGPQFVEVAKEVSNIDIQLIDGNEEARLITLGVLSALPPLTERILIMDIGGGSTEFVIADQRGVHWAQSFPIGVGVLYRGFHHQDPITYEEIVTLQDHLREVLQPLREQLEAFPTHHLVGSSGTFDVLAKVQQDSKAPQHPTSHRLKLEGLDELQSRLMYAPLAERMMIEGVPAERADMIAVAMVLLDFVIQLAGIERITVSEWAMKEGILFDQAAKS